MAGEPETTDAGGRENVGEGENVGSGESGGGRRLGRRRGIGRQESEAALDEIIAAHRPLQLKPRQVEQLRRAGGTAAGHERELLRALIELISQAENPCAVTAQQLSDLGASQGWPAELAGKPGDDGIREFANGKTVSLSPKMGLFYLYALHVLDEGGHPCMNTRPVRQLLRHLTSYARARAALGRSSRDGRGLGRMLTMGHAFYDMLTDSGRERPVSKADFEGILSGPLLSELPVAQDAGDVGAFALNAVRLGIADDNEIKYVASKIELTRVAPEGEDEVIHVLTRMEKDGQVKRRSEGFLVPRSVDVYFAQYHFDGSGLNIAAVHLDTFRAATDFAPGVILAVDRQGHAGGIAARIAFFRTSHPDKLVGSFTRSGLLKAIDEAQPLVFHPPGRSEEEAPAESDLEALATSGAEAQAELGTGESPRPAPAASADEFGLSVLEYLHHAVGVMIRKPEDPPGSYNDQIRTWGELAAYVASKEGEQAIARDPHRSIFAHNKHPMQKG